VSVSEVRSRNAVEARLLLALEQQVVDTGRALVDRQLVVGSTGNVSVRRRHGFLITPTRVPYDRIEPRDLVVVDFWGSRLARCPRAPSREWPLHAAIYRSCPDVSAVLHTHSVHATAWSFLDEPLEPRLEDSTYYDVGTIKTSAPAPAGSTEIGEAAVEALGGSRAALLGRHGVVTVGATLEEALVVAEVVEREAQVAWLLRGAASKLMPDRMR